jgi:hypothetical protein
MSERATVVWFSLTLFAASVLCGAMDYSVAGWVGSRS